MKYTILSFCSDLFKLIDDNKSPGEISVWANETYLSTVGRCSAEEIENFLSDLSMMDTPGFEISNLEIISRCIKMICNEYANK